LNALRQQQQQQQVYYYYKYYNTLQLLQATTTAPVTAVRGTYEQTQHDIGQEDELV